MKASQRLSRLVLAGALAALTPAAALADKIKHPTAVFAGLDKITGRIISFEVAVNETVQFGSLEITPRVCYSRPATEAPQTDVFAEVDEVVSDKPVHRLFTGWMFADSPGLHGIEHPVYDIWLTDCKGDGPLIHEAPEIVQAPPGPDSDPNALPTPVPTVDPNKIKKRKPKPSQPLEAPLDLSGAPPPVQPAPAGNARNPVARQFFPAASAPIPPAPVGQ